MDQPSQLVAERYQIVLPSMWCDWFDRDAQQLEFAGEFRTPSRVDTLLEQTPGNLWPGLMLPDTLPILGNDYGDWICVRVDATDRFGELLHWYHGGGDWIPLGPRLAEAVLHDAVDQFRPRSRQVLRGAPEITSPDHLVEVCQRLSQPSLRTWLTNSLSTAESNPSATHSELQKILSALAVQDHAAALQNMLDANWAWVASACDRIEMALQAPTLAMAHADIPKQLGMNWEPDYLRWLFDAAQIPAEALQQIQEIINPSRVQAVSIQQQDWHTAENLACAVLGRRQDLGWASDIAGWGALRRGDGGAAAQIFFQGRQASAFSDQSVRMRTHWFDPQFGKFAIAQLWTVRDQLAVRDREDPYLQTVWQTPSRLVQREVQQFWVSQGKDAMRQGQFEAAYQSFYQAGWDLGAQRMTDYLDILMLLVESAEAAGWKGRAAVAATHLACLSQSMLPRR